MALGHNAQTELEPAALAEARGLLGVPLRRNQHNRLVTRPAIHRWAKSVGERNPLWLESDYAAGSILGQTVAPPCWLYSMDDTCIAPKLAGLHVIYAGTDWEFYRCTVLGDRILPQSRLIDIQEKQGRFCGAMVLQTGETMFNDGGGQPVARAISKVLRIPRQGAVSRGKYRDWRKHIYSLQELRAIEDAYDAEAMRGATPRYWESVTVGEALPTIVRGPLTSEEMIQFVAATRPSLGFQRFQRHRQRHPDAAFLDPETGAWESWEASMLRDDVARMFGFPFAHDAGIDRISWVATLITNWMGDHGFLKSLSVTLTLPNIYGDVTWCRGQVARLYRQEGQGPSTLRPSSEGSGQAGSGQGLVELEVWCDNQRGQQTALGRATVALPSRGAPVP